MKAFRFMARGSDRAVLRWVRRFAALLAVAVALAFALPAAAHDDMSVAGAAESLSLESARTPVSMPCGTIDDSGDCGCVGLGGCHVAMAVGTAQPFDPEPRSPGAHAREPKFDGCDIAPPIHPPRVAIAG